MGRRIKLTFSENTGDGQNKNEERRYTLLCKINGTVSQTILKSFTSFSCFFPYFSSRILFTETPANKLHIIQCVMFLRFGLRFSGTFKEDYQETTHM